jgi:PleD family two-component response regulator
MTQPLALVVYEKLLPGTQLVNRLQDMGYRVQVVDNPSALLETAEATKPLIVFVDLQSTRVNMLEAVAALKAHSPTSHLPVVAFGPEDDAETQQNARTSGVTLLASEVMLANHLPQVLEQALRID